MVKPTSLAELKEHTFLAKRLDGLTRALMSEPDASALWIGAGVSAKYAGLPTWSKFLWELLETHVPRESRDFGLMSSLLDSGRLALAAECLQEVMGSKVRDALVDQMGASSRRIPDEISYLGVRDVITTNYDLVLEASLRGYQMLLPSSGLAKLLSNDFKIVKIHGSVANPDSCVLSLTNYVRAYNVNLNWYLTNIFSTCSVVFLGCSMNPSEPYFDVLRILGSTGRMKQRHFAVVAVESNEEAKILGHRLKDYGIELVPYIADENHTFLDELVGHIESHRGSSETIRHRLAVARADLEKGHTFRAGLRLWHACHAKINKVPDRQALADVVSEFFLVALERRAEADRTSFVHHCANAGINLPQMMHRTLDLIGDSSRTVNAFFKLRKVFPILEKASGERLPVLGRKFDELGIDIESRRPNG